MADFGTYASNYIPFTPVNVLPEPSDMITWDWMDTVAQFAQRFTKIATYIATIAYADSYVIDYTALGCDYFPPLIKAYIYRESGVCYEPDWDGLSVGGYSRIKKITLSSGTFENWIGREAVFQFVVMW